jgi:hypothetical protein
MLLNTLNLIAAVFTIISFICFVLGIENIGILRRWIRQILSQDGLTIAEGELGVPSPAVPKKTINEYVAHNVMEVIDVRVNKDLSLNAVNFIVFCVIFVPILSSIVFISLSPFMENSVVHVILALVFVSSSSFWAYYQFSILALASTTFATPTEIRIINGRLTLISPASIFEDMSGNIVNIITVDRSRISFGHAIKVSRLNIRSFDVLTLFIAVDGTFNSHIILIPRWFAQLFHFPDLSPIAWALNHAISSTDEVTVT